MAKSCPVFVSSTREDLKEYRKAVRDAILAAGLQPVMMEDFAASGNLALPVCLEKVAPCEVVVVLVAQRYGWVPEDQPAGGERSITWLECDSAATRGKEILAFLVAPDAEWPVEKDEAYRLTAAVKDGTFLLELATEVMRNVAKLKDFVHWLEKWPRRKFKSPEDLRGHVLQALYEWLGRHPEFKPSGPRVYQTTAYLKWLREETGTIDIRGLGVGAGKAHRFPIADLYIPLTTARLGDRQAGTGPEQREPMDLREALEHRRLVIVGDPGSGKTTFLRRIAFERAERGTAAEFPVFIPVLALAAHIAAYSAHAELEKESPQWLAHYLSTQGHALNWGLPEEFFTERLESGEAVVLLDGLDEAPDHGQRESVGRLFENATHTYRKCRFVVTTRPQGFAKLRDFHEARIELLDQPAIETFLDKWCAGLFAEKGKAEAHRKELSEALARPEIRDMARNPVMLTALVVVHWHEKRLPEQRADLYDSILTWLSRQRESRPGREKATRCLTLLESLALAMQLHPQGRQVLVPMDWAAAALARQFGSAGATEAAEFLERETADSGIIVSRGGELKFWHLTFQEYLAARAIGGLPEAQQKGVLFTEDRIWKPEWREVAVLLAGVLYGQGKGKTDGLVSAMLGRTPTALAEQARTAGLLGGMVRDLTVFDYQPADERYAELMTAVMGIFDRDKSAQIPFEDRLAAAEALGQAGDPRLAHPNWVRVNGLDIGKYPVTVQEYRRFFEAEDGYWDSRWWGAGGAERRTEPARWEEQKKHPGRPVTYVSWFAASAYCAWAGGRLLKEAEWESAARGAEGREFPWGNEEPDASRANYAKSGPGHLTPVGLYPAGATPEGLQDMAANVWEWVEDWYDDEKKFRCVRGGVFGDAAVYLRAAVRGRVGPGSSSVSLGFRCVREV